MLLGSRFTDEALEALAARVPTLLVARRTTASGVGVVRGDDQIGIGLAVDHLVKLGHRRIAHVDGADAAGQRRPPPWLSRGHGAPPAGLPRRCA